MTEPQQHTTNASAPWTVDYQPGAVAADITDADGTAVAEVYVWLNEEAACLAIAHQMAASREMAEALRNMLAFTRTGVHADDKRACCPICSTILAARTALALAEPQP